MTTDTSEKGLESLIVRSLIDEAGYATGDPKDYDRDHAIDLAKLLAFLIETQPEAFEGLHLEDDCPARRKFLARLQGEISKRGVIDVLRKNTSTVFSSASWPGCETRPFSRWGPSTSPSATV